MIQEYIQDTAKKTGVHSVTRWGARVVDLQKEEAAWKVTWSLIPGNAENGNLEDEFSEVSVLSKLLRITSHVILVF